MYELKKIVVSVDLSELDEEVIRYASVITEIMDADRIYFVYIAKNLNLPKEVAKNYSDVLAPVDETIKHEVKATVETYFSERKDTKSTIEVMEGNPTDKLLKYIRRKDADLVICGRHANKANIKVNIRRIAELSGCSALFVPKNADIKIDHLVVAMDFSQNADNALEQALQIAKAGNDVKVYGHHVYTVPSGYSRTGKSYEEFADIMLENAKKDAHSFFKKYHISDKDCTMTYSLSEDDKVHDELDDFAENHDADMILVGSRGRTAAASILLGSVSERLLHYDNNIPLFVVKE